MRYKIHDKRENDSPLSVGKFLCKLRGQGKGHEVGLEVKAAARPTVGESHAKKSKQLGRKMMNSQWHATFPSPTGNIPVG